MMRHDDQARLAHARHELCTPLNHIIGYSEMLLEGVEETGATELAGALRRVHGLARDLVARINEALAGRDRSGGLDLDACVAQLRAPVDPLIQALGALEQIAAGGTALDVLDDIDRMRGAGGHLRTLVTEGIDAPAMVAALALATATAGAPAPVAAGTILIVDDDAESRDLLSRRLARDGHRLESARNGRDALDALRARAFDLELLDVLMPGLSGYDVLRTLKADEALRDIPVLMISALDELDSAVQCIELGADDYLTKPYDTVLFRARIGACLERKRLRDADAQHRRELADWNRLLEQRVADQVAELERLGKIKRS